MVRKLKQPSTFRLWQMYESDRHRGNAGKNEPFGVMGTFVVRLAMPVKGEMRRFIHEAEDLVVFAPDLYKLPKFTEGCANCGKKWRLTLLECACCRTVSHSFYILKRRQAKKPPIFSPKLRGTLIPNVQSGSGGIHRATQHDAPRYLNAELPLTLIGAHARDIRGLLVE